jgi:phosphate transport system substrate-binding protein
MKSLYWCFMHGDELTRGIGFAPLPTNLQARLASRFAQVIKDGKQPKYATF